MNSAAFNPVLASMTPVFLLIALGYVAGWRQWVRASALKDLTNLVFLLLIPALLFRTMSQVRFEQLDLMPLLAYFSAAGAWWLASVAWRGFTPQSIVLALGGTFSNMVMIGIALVGLAYGQAGLVTLLTLVSVHALTLLTAATVLLEIAVARQQRRPDVPLRIWRTAWVAFKSALIHPVPLPILCGLLFAQTGWAMPEVIDRPLQLLGSAFGPIALLLVGVSMAATPLRGQWTEAIKITVSKNLLLPLLVGLSAWAWGIGGLPLTVLVVTAALPVGANVFLFSQRYNVATEATTVGMGLSTALAVFSLGGVMLVMAAFNPAAG